MGRFDVKRVKTGSSMLVFISSLLAAIRAFFRDRGDVALEVLVLRRHIAALKRKRPRPPLTAFEWLFWTTLLRFRPRWTDVPAIVKSNTVVGRHRAGFRIYRRWHSRPVSTSNRSPVSWRSTRFRDANPNSPRRLTPWRILIRRNSPFASS